MIALYRSYFVLSKSYTHEHDKKYSIRSCLILIMQNEGGIVVVGFVAFVAIAVLSLRFLPFYSSLSLSLVAVVFSLHI